MREKYQQKQNGVTVQILFSLPDYSIERASESELHFFLFTSVSSKASENQASRIRAKRVRNIVRLEYSTNDLTRFFILLSSIPQKYTRPVFVHAMFVLRDVLPTAP